MHGVKLELSNAERNALLDAAGRERIAPIAQSLLEQAKHAGLSLIHILCNFRMRNSVAQHIFDNKICFKFFLGGNNS